MIVGLVSQADVAWLSAWVAVTSDVVGLPPGDEARISSVPPHEWRILRIRTGRTAGWYGKYPTAEAALASLQAERDADHRQRDARRLRRGAPRGPASPE
jgi:hypothetical protein